MSTTTFSVENTVIVLIDHQVGTIGWAGELSSEQEKDEVKMWALLLARFAEGAGMPLVLTSGQQTEQQGPLLPELQDIAAEEYDARIQRVGVVNAWQDPAFAEAVGATGRKNLVMAGVTTDVCLVPPALSARAEGLNIVALTDASAATTRSAGQNSRDLLRGAGIQLMTVVPMITSMLGDFTVPAAAGLFDGMAKEGLYEAYARGNLR